MFAMSIPSQAELYAEVDRQFKAEHPEAPDRLDPNDANQQAWVHRWLELRDHLLNEWTDHVFFEHFPHAGRLDPANPADADLIEYWKDIHHQISSGETGRWNWSAAPAPPLDVVTIEPDLHHHGFVLGFNQPLNLLQAEDFLWPGAANNGLPVGVTMEIRSDTHVFVHPTIDSLRMVRDDIARVMSDSSVMTGE